MLGSYKIDMLHAIRTSLGYCSMTLAKPELSDNDRIEIRSVTEGCRAMLTAVVRELEFEEREA